MKLSQYQNLVCGNSAAEDSSPVLDRLRRLGRILRVVAQESNELGYSLEELANIDLEN